MSKVGEVIFIEGGRVIDPASGTDGVRDGASCATAGSPRWRSGCERPRDARAIDARGPVGDARASSTSTSTCASRARSTRRRSRPGARAAVAGGFTAVCAMPNTAPLNDNARVTELILRARGGGGAGARLPGGRHLQGARRARSSPSMAELRAAGCVALSDDGKPVMTRRSCAARSSTRAPFGAAASRCTRRTSRLVGEGVMHEGPAVDAARPARASRARPRR